MDKDPYVENIVRSISIKTFEFNKYDEPQYYENCVSYNINSLFFVAGVEKKQDEGVFRDCYVLKPLEVDEFGENEIKNCLIVGNIT